ncbi:YqiJ family protein [Myroides odoratus]|uniref:YqiJ family protein n=1 Tax=Myroides odoratus TaxID=256 RepID=UPI0021694706|nr:YqiJ family protein [Myroides odoratus]MCS4240364.1 hypothetical protein [Myroides odoratus]MDH6601474.1 hypothetical protein [Myroides gitamensis]
MKDIIHHLFFPVSNAIMTVLMIISVIYWLFSALMGGLDGIGIDAQPDVDVDVDVDTNFDLQQNHVDILHDKDPDIDEPTLSHESNLFIKLLHYMNVGQVPFMMVLTIFKFFTWAGSLLTTISPHIIKLGNWSIIILIPLAIVAIILTHYVTLPLGNFLKKTGYHGDESIDFIGREGLMQSSIDTDKHGIMQLVVDQDPIKIMVASWDGEPIQFGDRVYVIERSKTTNLYYVVKRM